MLQHNVESIGELNEAFGHLLIFKDSEGNLLQSYAHFWCMERN